MNCLQCSPMTYTVGYLPSLKCFNRRLDRNEQQTDTLLEHLELGRPGRKQGTRELLTSAARPSSSFTASCPRPNASSCCDRYMARSNGQRNQASTIARSSRMCSSSSR